MNKRIDFTQLEGFGLTQDGLDFMQTSYRSALSAIAAAFGNKVIVSGVTISGGNVTDGWVVIDGELLPFVGGIKADNVITQEATDVEQFADLSVKTVYYTKSARCAVTGGFPFSDLKRLDTVIGMLTSLTGIITAFTGHTHSYNDLTDKPTIPEQLILRRAQVTVPDFGGFDYSMAVNFADIGTSDYVVCGSLVSQGNLANDNELSWMTKNHTNTGFTLVIADKSNVATNVRLNYAIIKM